MSILEGNPVRSFGAAAMRPAARAVRASLPRTAALLTAGGDARIALDPKTGLNKYGCAAAPDPALAAFGSSTASVISEAAFAAADELRERLLARIGGLPRTRVYAEELDRMRGELATLCGVSDLAGVDIAFAASGTDLHLIAAQLVAADAGAPPLIAMMSAAETGSGVPMAFAGRHFSDCTALGSSVASGTAVAGGNAVEVAEIAIRAADGAPRPVAAVDAEVTALVRAAAAAGRRVLVTLVDVSKTGLAAPSAACARDLKARWPDRVEVLVDACQFRLAGATLRAFLKHDFIVAITGSKFLTGPAFSGALLIPAGAAARLRRRALPEALAAYSARADWPAGWAAADLLPEAANFGMLLRWEAALAELRAFRALPEPGIVRFFGDFAAAATMQLAANPVFAPLAVNSLDRGDFGPQASWDRIPTIFPFRLVRPGSFGRDVPLDRAATDRVYRALAASACQLGQPVACGHRDGVAVSALRLCASARLAVEALADNGRNHRAVIERAVEALDRTQRCAVLTRDAA